MIKGLRFTKIKGGPGSGHHGHAGGYGGEGNPGGSTPSGINYRVNTQNFYQAGKQFTEEEINLIVNKTLNDVNEGLKTLPIEDRKLVKVVQLEISRPGTPGAAFDSDSGTLVIWSTNPIGIRHEVGHGRLNSLSDLDKVRVKEEFDSLYKLENGFLNPFYKFGYYREWSHYSEFFADSYAKRYTDGRSSIKDFPIVYGLLK